MAEQDKKAEGQAQAQGRAQGQGGAAAVAAPDTAALEARIAKLTAEKDEAAAKATAAETQAKETEVQAQEAIAAARHQRADEDAEGEGPDTDGESAEALGLDELSFRELERLKGAVAAAMGGKGTAPEQRGPTLEELSGSFPVNREAAEELEGGEVATKAEVDVEDILDWTIRQKRTKAGGWLGPEYLRVVTNDGKKHIVALN